MGRGRKIGTRGSRSRLAAVLGSGAGALRIAAAAAMLALLPPAAAPAAENGGDYLLAPGDSIAVMVFGQPQLSAKMTVDDAGNVVVPFVGPVKVTQQSLATARELIQRRLADGFLKDPLVSVSIDRLRPIYILGDVQRPGSYPFQYGSTVESAVALAGGFGVAGLRRETAIPDYLSAEERLRQLASEQLALRVREVRLEAERDGGASFAVPDLPNSAGDKKLAKLVADEEAVLHSQSGMLAAEIRLLEEQKPRLQRQIDVVGKQIVTGQKQLDFVKSEEERSSQLLKQGLGVRGTEVQMRLDEANVENNLLGLNAQLSRSQMDLGNLDLEIEKARAAYKKQAVDDLQKVRERLAALKVELPSAWSIRNIRLQQVEGAVAAGQKHAVEITRRTGGRVVVLKGAATTPLQPGDAIEVKPVLPDHSLATPDG